MAPVKWNKQLFDVDTATDIPGFMRALQAATGVPVERQKIMGKGLWKGVLKPSSFEGPLKDLSGWKKGCQIVMMGSATELVVQSSDVQFVEDMTSTEKAKAGAGLPSGLQNLGM